MKVAFVAGFFSPVLEALKQSFEAEINAQLLIWIPQVHHGPVDCGKLKQQFFDRLARGATEVLILLVVLRKHPYVADVVDSLIAEGHHRCPESKITIRCFKDAVSPGPVAQAVRDFELAQPGETTPDSLAELESWAKENLAGKLILCTRAVNGAKKSQFEDYKLIYRSLLFLANEYRNERIIGSEGPDGRCEAKLAELGLELTNSISQSRAGEQGEDYYVIDPSSGERQFLKLHLKKGTSREARRCLRIYFFWDAVNLIVVVGSLPAHLGTRIS